jgi:hypothetical protein
MTWQQFKQAWLIKFWSPVPAVIAAGILSTYYFGITGTFWAVTGEFTRWGGQLLQLVGVHSEEWGYYKLIHLEGTPLTRIDGMMIIGMFGGCFAAALWANNVKLRFPAAGSAFCRPSPGESSPVSAPVWRWAAIWPHFYRYPTVFSARLVLCHRYRYRNLVRRALYLTAHLPYSGKNAESVPGLAADAKT